MKTVHTFSSALSRYIAGANYLTALTGAGVSAESGIPTFRGGDGLWNRYRPEELATPEAFSRDPETVWRWYAWRMERVFSALPNPAHLAFAKLQERGRLRSLITQNVDDLHERAGSRDVLHLHGTLRQMRCVTCGRRVPVDRPPEVPPLPVCACGALMRPDVVWFGEALQPDVLERAFAEASRSDVMIVAGTVTYKMAPRVKRLFDQMPEPKYVIAMGACVLGGGPYSLHGYHVVKGVDKIVPVDVYVPGCPPRPETLLEALMRLQEKVRSEHPVAAKLGLYPDPLGRSVVDPRFPQATEN
mgnify:CR=1 FL=1